MKKPVYYAIIAVLLVVFGASAFMVVNYFVQGSKNESSMDDLRDLVNSPTSQATTQATQPAQPSTEAATEGTTAPTEPTEPGMIPGYAAAYELNQDMVGWIRIDGTRINYPVMQTPNDGDYYLKRNFEKEYSDWGSIYIRDCDINKPSDVITLYGHCMRDGSMFADLHKYTDKAFWENHQLIYFDTLMEYHVYEIYAVFITSANLGEGFRYHTYIDFADEAQFNEYVNTVRDLSLYNTGIVPVYGDKMIALSTCEYTEDNNRLVVVARRVF